MNLYERAVSLLVFLVAITGTLSAGEIEDSVKWNVQTKATLFFAQSSYGQYWKGTGQNSLELGSTVDFQAKRTHNGKTWEHKALVRYGLIKLGDQAFQKNEDQVQLETRFSQEISKHFKISGLLTAQTHMYDFYALDKEGVQSNQIGGFLAPGFFHLGSGVDISSKSKALRLFYTPINSKLTVVTDEILRPQFLPEEIADQGIRYELGSLLKVQVEKEVLTNIFFKSTGTFFTSHLQNFGNFDVDIEGNLRFKVNKFFEVNLRTHLIYDEDIKFAIDENEAEASVAEGPRTQFKEVLHIGMSHTF